MAKKNQIQVPSRYISDMLNIIYVIATNEQANPALISEALGLEKTSVWRHLGRIRKNLFLDIEYVREKGSRGKAGYYQINSWGILDKKSFLDKFTSD